MNKIDLAGQWMLLWGPLQSAAPGLINVLSFVAFFIALIAIIKFFMAKQQGKGADTKGLLWTAAVCIVLAMPGTILPTLLTVIDWMLNFGMDMVRRVTGTA